MAPIEWKREFETGIPDVDYEHAGLIDLINGLISKLHENPSRELVSDVLAQINAKISAHFALEEKIMRERSYDQYADHKADHERLLDDIREIMDTFERDTAFAYEDALTEHLIRWFVVHFKTKDARLHKMLM